MRGSRSLNGRETTMTPSIPLGAKRLPQISRFTAKSLRALPLPDPNGATCGVSFTIMTGKYRNNGALETRPFCQLTSDGLDLLGPEDVPATDLPIVAVAHAAITTDRDMRETIEDLVETDFNIQSDIAVNVTCLRDTIIVSNLDADLTDGVESFEDLTRSIQAAYRIYMSPSISAHQAITITEALGTFMKAVIDSDLALNADLPQDISDAFDAASLRITTA
jgi:hypothetical protein